MERRADKECNVDVHASRDAVGCPGAAKTNYQGLHHTTLPFDLQPSTFSLLPSPTTPPRHFRPFV
jgi:hypothetical protein